METKLKSINDWQWSGDKAVVMSPSVWSQIKQNYSCVARLCLPQWFSWNSFSINTENTWCN